jgi:hypothetical protein
MLNINYVYDIKAYTINNIFGMISGMILWYDDLKTLRMTVIIHIPEIIPEIPPKNQENFPLLWALAWAETQIFRSGPGGFSWYDR